MRIDLHEQYWLVGHPVTKELSLEEKPKNDINITPTYPLCNELMYYTLKLIRRLTEQTTETADAFAATQLSFSGVSSIRVEKTHDRYSIFIKHQQMKKDIFITLSRQQLLTLSRFIEDVLGLK